MDKGHTIDVLDKGYVRFIDNLGDDKRICESARISYKSPSKGDEQDKKLLFYLWKNHHTSPFEQCSITYNIKLPLFVQAHLVRHRTQRLNQVSARYTEMPDEFYIPYQWRKQDTKNKQGSVSVKWEEDEEWALSQQLYEHCDEAYKLYEKFLKYGVAREMARMILPQNLYTEIYSNWDLNNLMRFFSLRIDSHAQEETKVYAQAMYDIFKELYPWCAEAYEKYKWKLIENE